MRKYEEGDESKIVKLMEDVYGKWFGVNYWNWKYKDNTAGFYKDLIWLAEDDDRVVGQYTIIPIKMMFRGNEIIGSQSVDTATHSDYRRQGIFEVLANETYAHAAKHGISITYGFADGASRKGFLKKLNWHHVCFLMQLEKVLDYKTALGRHFKQKYPKILINILASLLRLRDRLRRISIPKDIKINKIRFFDERINEFWRDTCQHYDVIVKRDLDYFNWRLGNPNSEYVIYIAERDDRIMGYIILKHTQIGGRIVDILALPSHDNVAMSLIFKAIEYFKNKGVDMLRCRMPRTHVYYKILKKFGFISTQTTMGFIARANFSDLEGEETLKNIKNWFIMDLDTDHV